MKPLVADIYCGLGGWTEGFIAEGYDCVGFDIERHHYGDAKYPGDLVLQDARTIHGKQLRDAAVIVASSPCQAYSYMAMPWKRAKQIARALRGEDVFPEGYTGYRTIAELNELFEQPKRIQREACEAAGRYIPMIQENVRGAIPWVGRSRWNFGSYHLWGDVPAVMPFTHKGVKVSEQRQEKGGVKVPSESGRRTDIGKGARFTSRDCGVEAHIRGVAINPDAGTKGYAARLGESTISCKHWSSSPERKAASAAIAKIPFPLASHIARVYKPSDIEQGGKP